MIRSTIPPNIQKHLISTFDQLSLFRFMATNNFEYPFALSAGYQNHPFVCVNRLFSPAVPGVSPLSAISLCPPHPLKILPPETRSVFTHPSRVSLLPSYLFPHVFILDPSKGPGSLVDH